MKKWVFRTLIVFSSLLLTTGIVLGVGLSYGNKENINKLPNYQEIKNNKVIFDNQEFDSINDAYDYARMKTNMVSYQLSNKNLYSLNVDNQIKLFDSMLELNDFVNNKIKIIENCETNIIQHNLDPIDNSIYINDLYKYNIDISNNQKYSNNLINIYKKNGGGYVIVQDDVNEAIIKAKESYLEIHKAFYFNGIYFKSKQDLEIYIRNVYVKKFTNDFKDDVNNKKYKKIYYFDEQGKIFVSQPIDFSRDIDNVLIEIARFLNTNNHQYLRIYDSNTNQPQFLKFDRFQNSIIGNIGELISINNLPILKKLNNDNKSLYIVDANINEEFELYGPYFLNTDKTIDKITDPNGWNISNDSPYEVVRSQVITLLSSFLDLFLTRTDYNQSFSKSHDSLFYLSELSNEVYDAEQNLLNALSKIKTSNDSNLLNDLYQMFNSLQNTKSYCTLYAIPTIYNYLKDQLIINQADPLTVILFKTYFDVLCDNIQAIFEGIFGDLLNEFNNDNGKRFNFAQFFGINVYGFDGSNIGSILNGSNLLKYYKPLIAGCYVFMKAIANSQNMLIPNYDAKDDNYLYNLLEEGKNLDQNNANKIKEIFVRKGTCNQLNAIYQTFSNWSNIIDENLFNWLDNYKTNLDNNIDNKLTTLYSIINEYKTINKPIPSQVYDEFYKMQQVLNVKQEYQLNNQRKVNSFLTFFNKSFISKQTSNLEFKLNGITEANSFIKKQTNSWTGEEGVFSKYKSSSDYETLINNLNISISNSSYQEIVQQTTIINQINITKNKDLMEKIEIGEKIVNEFSNIATSIIGIINDVKNEKFKEVNDQIIAAGVMSICASIANITSNLTPPPINVIAKAASFVFSFVSSAIGEAEVQIYEYIVDENTKYYWDGGLVMKRFWGLWNDTIRDISNLKMQSPIQIIRSQNSDNLYFNDKEYEVEDDGIAKKDAIEFILNTMNEDDEIYNMISSKFSWVYSLESNVNNVSDQNAFEKIYSTNLDEMTLAKYAGQNNVIEIGEELFLDGYSFANQTDLEENLNKNILEVIKPFYIAKIPDLDINNTPLNNQTAYHIPYPYFEPSNSDEKQLVCAKNISIDAKLSIDPNSKNQIETYQDQEYIIYNANSVNNSMPSTYAEATINDIFNNIKQRFIKTFDIESKRVLKTNLLESGNEYFDDIETNLQKLNIYYVEIEPGVKKYFINKIDAERYIFKITTNDNIKLDLISKNIYEYKSNKEIIYFESLQQFNKWFIANTIVLNGGN